MACRIFQKRHLLAHKMGVIDAEYVQKAISHASPRLRVDRRQCLASRNDPGAVVGRRIRVTSDEVAHAIGLVETLGQGLFKGLLAGE